jgi:hypothetical protein
LYAHSIQRLRRIGSFVAALVALVLLLAGPAASSNRPLTTGLADWIDSYPDPAGAMTQAKRAGMTTVDVMINWAQVAPAARPGDWSPTDPADPHYDWSVVDRDVRTIAAAGLQPLAVVVSAPSWARVLPKYASSAPAANDFAQFTKAAATRYDGRHGGLPRVRYWRIWNEPNITPDFRPQFDPATKRFVSPDLYRDLVNRAAAVIHAAARGNLVIAGGTAPFADSNIDVRPYDDDWGPLKFMRRLLCVDDSGRPSCDSRISFDIWSTHPYTSGGPTHHANGPYDVSLGDLSKMRRTLDAAIRAGHIESARPVRFWVTEFAWDSNAPDPCAVPIALLKRWVPEALYRMWANGIDQVSWFKLMDDPLDASLYQSGLYFHATRVGAAKAKPFLEGFRFPFVAVARGRSVYVWARVPARRPQWVTIQHASRGGWSYVTTSRADQYGLVHQVVRARADGRFRAVLGSGERSLPFAITDPPDRFFLPFGATVLSPHLSDCVF